MKRIKVHDAPRNKPKAERRIKYCPSRSRIKRIRVTVAAPTQPEADDFVQYHLARITYAKEVQRQSFTAIAEYLAATIPAGLEQECRPERKRTRP